jgi:hypothetical protein
LLLGTLAALMLAPFVAWNAVQFATDGGGPHPELLPDRTPAHVETETATLPIPATRQPEQATPSERNEVRPASPASPRGHHEEVELHVVDAETGAHLSFVSARMLSAAVTPKPNAAREMDAGWISAPSLSEQPGPHITTLPIVASGPSPLACPTALGKELWITARGYGWARLSLFEAWPDRITIRLRRGAILEVTVAGHADYSRLLVTLTQTKSGSPRSSAKLRRTTRDGSVYFNGLTGGEYSIEVLGVPAAIGEIDRKSRTIVLRNREHRREVLSLETQWGLLMLRLDEPVDEQGERALQGVWINSLGPDVPVRRRTTHFEDFMVEGGSLSTTSSPLRLPLGKTLVTVQPHGVQYEVEVPPGSTVKLERVLPRLHKRRLTVWNTELDCGWVGSVRTLIDRSSAPIPPVQSAWFEHNTGTVDAYWPAVPFHLELDFSPAEEASKPLRFTSGAALPFDWRIELNGWQGKFTEPKDVMLEEDD